jgi:hypothetical protein
MGMVYDLSLGHKLCMGGKDEKIASRNHIGINTENHVQAE